MPPRGSPLRNEEHEDESSERAPSPQSRGKTIFKPAEVVKQTAVRTGPTPLELRNIDITTFTGTWQKFVKVHLPDGVIREEHRYAQKDFTLVTKIMRKYLAPVHPELEKVIAVNNPEEGIFEKANQTVYNMWLGVTNWYYAQHSFER